MSEMIAIKRVTLADHHLQPGRAEHTLIDSKGARAFPAFKSLTITTYPDSQSFYLMHECEDTGTDTWHESLDDALDQAEWEFGVQRNEWTDVNESY